LRVPRLWTAAAGFLPLAAPAARGQVAFSPQVAAFPNGVIMSATPAVSYDRRYVRLGMMPQFTAIEGFDTFSVPAAVGGIGAGGGGVAGVGGGGGGMMGFAGMNGPIGGPVPQGQSGFADDGRNARGRPGSSSDFEDQPLPPPARKVAARPAPQAKSKRKVATRPARGSASVRPAAKGARPR